MDPLVRSAQTTLAFERDESVRDIATGAGISKAESSKRLVLQSKARARRRFADLVVHFANVAELAPPDPDKLSIRAFAKAMLVTDRAVHLVIKNGLGLSLPWWLEALGQQLPEALAFYLESHLTDLARARPELAARLVERILATLPDDVASALLSRAENAFYLRKTATEMAR